MSEKYTGMIKIKPLISDEDELVDIPTMYQMPLSQYKDYLEFSLLWVDHHDVLRSEVAGFPIATTREQLDALIEYLQSLRHKMNPKK